MGLSHNISTSSNPITLVVPSLLSIPASSSPPWLPAPLPNTVPSTPLLPVNLFPVLRLPPLASAAPPDPLACPYAPVSMLPLDSATSNVVLIPTLSVLDVANHPPFFFNTLVPTLFLLDLLYFQNLPATRLPSPIGLTAWTTTTDPHEKNNTYHQNSIHLHEKPPQISMTKYHVYYKQPPYMYSMKKLHPMNNLQTFYENTSIINEHSMNSPNSSMHVPWTAQTYPMNSHHRWPWTTQNIWRAHVHPINTTHPYEVTIHPNERTPCIMNNPHYIPMKKEQPHIPMNKHHEFLWSTTTHPNEQRTNTTHPYEQTPHILMNSHHASYWANNVHSYEPPHIPMNKLIPFILVNNHHTSQWTNTHHTFQWTNTMHS